MSPSNTASASSSCPEGHGSASPSLRPVRSASKTKAPRSPPARWKPSPKRGPTNSRVWPAAHRPIARRRRSRPATARRPPPSTGVCALAAKHGPLVGRHPRPGAPGARPGANTATRPRWPTSVTSPCSAQRSDGSNAPLDHRAAVLAPVRAVRVVDASAPSRPPRSRAAARPRVVNMRVAVTWPRTADHRRGRRRRVRLARGTRGPRVLHAARRAHREAQRLQQPAAGTARAGPPRTPGGTGAAASSGSVPRDSAGLGYCTSGWNTVTRWSIRPTAFGRAACAFGLWIPPCGPTHSSDCITVTAKAYQSLSTVAGLRGRQRLRARIQPQRVQELLREHRTQEGAELEAVRIDEVRVRAHRQHVQVVEVPHHHAGRVHRPEHPVQSRQHRHRVGGLASRAAERRLAPAAQRLHAVQLAHRIAQHLRALLVRGQRLRRHHSRRKRPWGTRAACAGAPRAGPSPRPARRRQAQVVRVLGRLEDLERAAIPQVIHIRLAALAQRLLRIQPDLLSLQPDVHGLTPSPSGGAAPPAWCRPSAAPACAAVAAPRSPRAPTRG